MKFSGYFDGVELIADGGELIELGELRLLGDVFLFNKDVLADQLGIRYSAIHHYSDGQLVLLAFQKWQGACFEHLYGAWAFVLLDKKNKYFYLGRNASENSSLFYFKKDRNIFFSSDTIYFHHTLGSVLEVDLYEYAALSLRLIGNTPGSTIIKNLFHVIPGSFIWFDENMHEHRSSFVCIKQKKIRYKSEQDYFLQFNSVMANAVLSRVRERDNIGIFLSSGMDSTTVLGFLADAKEQMAGLHTYTSVPAWVDEEDHMETVSEAVHVKNLLSNFPFIASRFMSFPDMSFNEQLNGAFLNHFFYPIIHSNTFWIEGILRQAKLDGVEVMFTGQMGNYSISYTGDPGLKWFSVKYFLKNVRSLLTGKYFLMREQWGTSFFSDRLLSKIFDAGYVKKNFMLGYCFGEDSKSYRKSAFKKLHVFASTHWSILAQKHGLRVFDPTADQYLLEYLDAIPPDLFCKNGVKKYLLKMAMRNRLPNEILMNQYPKPQTADLGKRLQKENFLSEKVQYLMEQFKDNPFFDLKKLKTIHRDLVNAKSRGGQHVLGFQLLYMISLMLFYDQFTRRKN